LPQCDLAVEKVFEVAAGLYSTLDAGKTEELKFKFLDHIAAGPYSITVEFVGGVARSRPPFRKRTARRARRRRGGTLFAD